MPDQATIITVLDACGRAHVPSLLWSPPGMGKSSLVRGLAKASSVPCETVLGSIREPADVGGLPVTGEQGVTLEPPAFAKRLRAAGIGILFLDELTTCPPSVQAALLAVALDRTVGDVVLPSPVVIVGGANPADQAADGWDLAPPLANRFCHVNYALTTDDFVTGLTTDWSAPPASRAITADDIRRAAQRAAVAGFVKTFPHLMHAMPDNPAAAGRAWPSPRTWTMMADTLAHVRDDDTAAVAAVVHGLVGEGAGTEFLIWRANADLPDPETVIADPAAMDWTSRDDRVWAVLAGVVAYTAARGTQAAWVDAWGPVMAAADAGSPDIAAVAAKLLVRAQPAKARIPAAARRFAPILAAAGMDMDGQRA